MAEESLRSPTLVWSMHPGMGRRRNTRSHTGTTGGRRRIGFEWLAYCLRLATDYEIPQPSDQRRTIHFINHDCWNADTVRQGNFGVADRNSKTASLSIHGLLPFGDGGLTLWVIFRQQLTRLPSVSAIVPRSWLRQRWKASSLPASWWDTWAMEQHVAAARESGRGPCPRARRIPGEHRGPAWPRSGD